MYIYIYNVCMYVLYASCAELRRPNPVAHRPARSLQGLAPPPCSSASLAIALISLMQRSHCKMPGLAGTLRVLWVRALFSLGLRLLLRELLGSCHTSLYGPASRRSSSPGKQSDMTLLHAFWKKPLFFHSTRQRASACHALRHVRQSLLCGSAPWLFPTLTGARGSKQKTGTSPSGNTLKQVHGILPRW